MKHLISIALFATLSAKLSAQAIPGYGISSWHGWNPKQVSHSDCPELRSVPLIIKWESLEPSPGKHAFDETFGSLIKAAKQDSLQVSIKIYVGPACPEGLGQNKIDI